MKNNIAVVSNGFTVKKAGMLTMVQDLGRFGQANLGLTHGGPADQHAFLWANRLLENELNASALEITVGGLVLQVNTNTCICVTGADLEFKINGQLSELWQTHKVQQGDTLEFGFPVSGIKAYLAVAGGFQIEKQFGSTATVIREGIGGLSGSALQEGDKIAAMALTSYPQHKKQLPKQHQPLYDNKVTLRIVLGYQIASFNNIEQTKFLTACYQVSKQWDRMGYRLQGTAIKSTQSTMLSEGITLGAVQIPPDGQPIILMHDRQTIGGYPKIGSVLSIDLNLLAQCGQGAKVRFQAIDIDDAHNELHLAKYRFEHTKINETEW